MNMQEQSESALDREYIDPDVRADHTAFVMIASLIAYCSWLDWLARYWSSNWIRNFSV